MWAKAAEQHHEVMKDQPTSSCCYFTVWKLQKHCPGAAGQSGHTYQKHYRNSLHSSDNSFKNPSILCLNNDQWPIPMNTQIDLRLCLFSKRGLSIRRSNNTLKLFQGWDGVIWTSVWLNSYRSEGIIFFSCFYCDSHCAEDLYYLFA